MNFSCFKLSFFDPTHHVVEHNYLLTLILRYFAPKSVRLPDAKRFCPS